ncbi:uncharacterized protein ACNFOS_007566 [Eudromia elegans]
MSWFGLFCWILIQTFVVHTVSDTVITGEVGQSVRLPCSYRITRWRDISDMCWGKGTCPNSKCRNKILHTTGHRVTYRVSQRYNLHGYISYGDVSLTIKKVKEEDAGVYCCRIEIPGWFNDIKVNINLKVIRGTTLPTTTRFDTTTKLTMTPSASDLQATVMTETALLLTTVSPSATTITEVTVPLILVDPPATTESPVVTVLETSAPPTVTMTENDIFPENVVTTSAPIDCSTDFQAADITEDDYVLSSTGFINVPEVTTELPSELPSSEGTENADTSFITEDELTGVTVPPAFISPRYRNLNGLGPAYNPLVEDPATAISGSSNSKAVKKDDYQFPTHVVLITCSAVAFILLMLMLSALLRILDREDTKEQCIFDPVLYVRPP